MQLFPLDLNNNIQTSPCITLCLLNKHLTVINKAYLTFKGLIWYVEQPWKSENVHVCVCVCVSVFCPARMPSAAVHVFPNVLLKKYKRDIRKQLGLNCRHTGTQPEGCCWEELSIYWQVCMRCVAAAALGDAADYRVSQKPAVNINPQSVNDGEWKSFLRK